MLKKKKTPQQNMVVRRVIAVLLLALAALFTAAYFNVNANLAPLAKVEIYLLGKVALLLPIALFIIAWKAFFGARILVFSKKTCLFFLLTLCLLGTAHHLLVPFGEELYPEHLPEGGGLIGGSIILLAHRYLGEQATFGALAFGWLVFFLMLIPFKTIFTKLKSKPQEKPAAPVKAIEKKAKEPVKEQVPTKTLKMPERKVQQEASKNKLDDFYARAEFDEFTDGIKKQSTFQRVLNYGSQGTYDESHVKEAIEQDPVQLPEWQEDKHNVVMRPIINYDNKGKSYQETKRDVEREDYRSEAVVPAPMKLPQQQHVNRVFCVEVTAIEVVPQITIIDSAD